MWIRKLLIWSIAVVLSTAIVQQSQASDINDVPEDISFVYVHPESTPKTQWLIKIYTEALNRLGIRFKFVNVPSKRASLLSNSGEVDGELNRIAYYGDSYPNMRRVPEPNQQITVSAFTTSKYLSTLSTERLKKSRILIGYISGLIHLEKELPQQFTKARFTPLRDTEHGIKMLAKNRIDIFISNKEVTNYVLRTEEFKMLLGNDIRIYENIHYGYTRTYYAWLNKKHVQLAVPIAITLRKMKSEGLFELYKRQVNYHTYN